MRYELTHKEDSDRLILIFAGWSTTPEFYSDIQITGYDTMVVWDYSDFNFNESFFERYSTVCLFAWSMGVFVASKVVPWNKISMSVAVNGTLSPVDNEQGIPEKIFMNTIQGLSERNLLKFRKRMTGDKFPELSRKFTYNEIDPLKNELLNISNQSCTINPEVKWDRAIISTGDLIFPYENMERAWTQTSPATEIIRIDGPHFVDLKAVISGAVPLRHKVGERFRKAIPSYDDSATVQSEVASMLTNAVPKDCRTGRVLEIGPGSGILSKKLASRFEIDSMDFVDLFEIPKLGIAKEETYFSGDAEDWVATKAASMPHSYDLIVSASAIQWFVNPERFLNNCFSLLKDGGILALATYSRGNLAELQAVNPYGLVYLSAEQFNSILNPLFSRVEIKGEIRIIEFSSSKAILSHLAKTGVGGSSETNLPLHHLLKALPNTLTYTPLYIIAKK